ncbi:MAG: chemotaxis protein CheX [Spirochaetales bacterium]|nr:chemotaxis protein CheX [Spirochaetales bacterium]
MNAKFINPFIHASLNLFKEYMDVDIKPGKPFILDDPYDLMGVSAIIGLAGETTGALVLSFSRETAIAMVSRLEGKTYIALGAEILDGVGEMINIIAGNAKKDLAEFRISISLPGIITGNNYRINWPHGVPVISIPYESELGSFSINVSIKEA